MSPPVVKFINTVEYSGAVGDKIVARAIDDYRVTKVRMEIYAANGALLEAGNAQQNMNGLDWTYTTTTSNSALVGSKIKVIATDVPANEGTLEIVL